jgi:hypothetical protein
VASGEISRRPNKIKTKLYPSLEPIAKSFWLFGLKKESIPGDLFQTGAPIIENHRPGRTGVLFVNVYKFDYAKIEHASSWS